LYLGIPVVVDLNVDPKFSEINKLGVPKGYQWFATRGGRNKNLEAEFAIAAEIAGHAHPNFVVYSGGKAIRALCEQRG
jgi:hypothetical protein